MRKWRCIGIFFSLKKCRIVRLHSYIVLYCTAKRSDWRNTKHCPKHSQIKRLIKTLKSITLKSITLNLISQPPSCDKMSAFCPFIWGVIAQHADTFEDAWALSRLNSSALQIRRDPGVISRLMVRLLGIERALIHAQSPPYHHLLRIGRYPAPQTIVSRILIDNEHCSVSLLGRPLIVAAAKGCVQVLSVLLPQCAEVINYCQIHKSTRNTFYDGTTPLICAVAAGHIDATRLLICCGADVNKADNHGWTPLVHAVASHREDLAILLVAMGANHKVTFTMPDNDMEVMTPLTLSIHNKDKSMLHSLINVCNIDPTWVPHPPLGTSETWTEYDCRMSPMICAVMGEFVEAISLLANRARGLLDVRDQLGNTPLHIAAIHGRLAAVTALIEAGANADATGQNGRTPLMEAVRLGHEDCVSVLLESSAELTRVDAYNNGIIMHATMFPCAASPSCVNIIRRLLRANVPWNQRNLQGRTPLMEAARHLSAPCVFLLLQRDYTQINDVDSHLFTPLHHAAQCSNVNAMAVLLTAGSCVYKTDHQGRSPLMIAARYGGSLLRIADTCAVLELLIDAGSDVHMRDIHGATATDMARHIVEQWVASASNFPVLSQRRATILKAATEAMRIVDILLRHTLR